MDHLTIHVFFDKIKCKYIIDKSFIHETIIFPKRQVKKCINMII